MVWVTGGVSTLLVSWTGGHQPSSNHVVFLSCKAKKLILRNLTNSSPHRQHQLLMHENQ